ncbi:hypothetical protein GIY30_11410 [Gordonia sp. HNM0687]|uniref:Uncharacterized protein n=1 Tax=Gordonia mangrovi TaxID=2665643 RepID=A0A6L7GQ05_9ACTN|nr:hypothetical protein [Gordonia mangrovi]MXP21956.1 hypothetical protein [Gordonia mangrovi]UVF76316.1 hypothetical protein NWF22_13030 [Gordonia mangrovi]
MGESKPGVRAAVASVLFTVAVATGGAVAASPPAQAARIIPTAQPGVTVIELSHADTVSAAHLGAGHVINILLGNDNWGVILDDDSRYRAGSYYRPDKHRTWNDVTGQQVISEAGKSPGVVGNRIRSQPGVSVPG